MAAPDISLMGATYNGVTGVTLPKSGSGTATFPWVEGSQEITTNNTYDVTNLASIVVNVSGGSSVKTKTGTFTGNGTRQITISCDFEPDLIYWASDPGTSASSGTVTGLMARDMLSASQYRNNSTSNSNTIQYNITDMNINGSSYNYKATYANGTVTIYAFSTASRSFFTNNRVYSYKLIKWTT